MYLYVCYHIYMIKAVIFDCFGVLVHDGWLPFKQKYFQSDQALFAEATDLNKAVDAGYIDYYDFVSQVSSLAGISVTQAHTEIAQNPTDRALMDYIRAFLKPSYKIGMLSNAGANWLDDLFTPQELALFDATALSYEMGMVKPQAECYETIANRLDVSVDECIFIDDQERYCSGAVDAGMHAIHFTSTPQLITELTQVLENKPQPIK